jgi:hypothetical protein
MPEIPENIKKQLPQDFDEVWEVVEIEDIEKGDYISYFPKPRKYKSRDSESKPQLVKGGYVSFLPDEEKKAIRGTKENIIGLRSFKSSWSIAESDVYFFCRSKKNFRDILKKGVEKASETKTETRKRKAEILKDEIKQAEKISANKEVAEAVKAVEYPSEESPIKKKRGRPKKTT